MFFDALYWNPAEPKIEMKMISASGLAKASFESSDFYKDQRFQKIQGVSDINPLSLIKQYVKETICKTSSISSLLSSIFFLTSGPMSYGNFGFLR